MPVQYGITSYKRKVCKTRQRKQLASERRALAKPFVKRAVAAAGRRAKESEIE